MVTALQVRKQGVSTAHGPLQCCHRLHSQSGLHAASGAVFRRSQRSCVLASGSPLAACFLALTLLCTLLHLNAGGLRAPACLPPAPPLRLSHWTARPTCPGRVRAALGRGTACMLRAEPSIGSGNGSSSGGGDGLGCHAACHPNAHELLPRPSASPPHRLTASPLCAAANNVFIFPGVLPARCFVPPIPELCCCLAGCAGALHAAGLMHWCVHLV